MNEGLYEAVFCYGENKVDPFAKTCVDFDRIIGDMKLVGYELNSFNIAHHIMLEQIDSMIRTKGKIIEETMDLENRDEFCRNKYGLSFKDIDALDPRNDIECDIKSGKVIYYLTHEAKYKEAQYSVLFKKSFDAFTQKTGFEYVSQ
ncbi:MAG: hypothetical protein E7307_05655 [Butyrivibrio sp.]|nr:hypothetical protein [Butyrivibrio sp.]